MKRAGLAAALAIGLGCTIAAAQDDGNQGDRPQGSQTSPGSPQTGSQTGTSDRTTQGSGRSSQTVTLIGCVQSGGAATSGASGAAGSSASGQRTGGNQGTYMLMNARTASSTGAVGSTGAGGSDRAGNTGGNDRDRTGAGVGATTGNALPSGGSYTLEGRNMQQYVGQQVQVTGTMGAAAAGSSRERGTGTGSTTAGNAGGNSGAGSQGAGGGRTTTGDTSAGAAGESMTLRVTNVRTISKTCTTQ